MKKFAIIMALIALSSPLYAGIFQCTQDGRKYYQDQPCKSGVEMHMSARANDSMVGCYEVRFENTDEDQTEKWEIARSADGAYQATIYHVRSNSGKFPMQTATSAELQALSKEHRLAFRRGLSVFFWDPRFPLPENMRGKPVKALYQVEDRGSEGFVAYDFSKHGPAIKVSCKELRN
jgi:hypothetical protein